LSESDPADSHLRLARLLPERVGRRRLSNHDRPRRADSSSDIVPSRRDTWSDKRWDGGHAQDSAPCRGGPVSAFTNQAILRTACMAVTVSTGWSDFVRPYHVSCAGSRRTVGSGIGRTARPHARENSRLTWPKHAPAPRGPHAQARGRAQELASREGIFVSGILRAGSTAAQAGSRNQQRRSSRCLVITGCRSP
jgi:hypothetical protein